MLISLPTFVTPSSLAGNGEGAWSICAWLSTKPLSCTPPLRVTTAMSKLLTFGVSQQRRFHLGGDHAVVDHVAGGRRCLPSALMLFSTLFTPATPARRRKRAIDLRLVVDKAAQQDDALAGFHLEVEALDGRDPRAERILTFVVTTVSSSSVPAVVLGGGVPVASGRLAAAGDEGLSADLQALRSVQAIQGSVLM